MPLQSDFQDSLDQCILANTYLGEYFLPDQDISGYDIFISGKKFNTKDEMYEQVKQLDFSGLKRSTFDNSLWIDELVYINTKVNKKEKA